VLAHCAAVQAAEKPSGSRQTEARRARETCPGYNAQKKQIFLVPNGSHNEEGKMAACFVPEQKTKTAKAEMAHYGAGNWSCHQTKRKPQREEQHKTDSDPAQTQKGKTNSIIKMSKSIFPWKSRKFTTDLRMSPSSIPYLIIRTRKLVYDTLILF
jgi:hypothetical protein